MALSDHVYLYCERGLDPSLLAEPINAASNAAFLLAALAGLVLLLRRPAETRSADHYLLIALILAIGLGSLTFHLYATKGTELADTIPIGIFMLVYLGFALTRLLGVPPGWTVLLVIGFAVLGAVSLELRCFDGGIGFPDMHVKGAGVCLNGSVGYLPALLAMAVIGALLRERGSRAGGLMLWAALVFAVSVTLRSLDLAFCSTLTLEDHRIGTHAAWHVLNAVTLFLLLLASFEAPEARRRPAARSGGDETGSFL
jgi:Ceramidase